MDEPLGSARRDLIRRWLKGYGHSPAEIAVALAWYDAEIAVGRQPKDSAVQVQADAAHADAVARTLGDTDAPIAQITHLHQHTHQFDLSWKLYLSAAAGGATIEALRWALALMR